MKDLERDEPAVTMREITVQHPAPKMTIEITWTQDEEVGDGTNSVIVLAAEMQGGPHRFQEEKRHPNVGIQAYRQAPHMARPPTWNRYPRPPTWT